MQSLNQKTNNGINEVELLFFNADFAKMSLIKAKCELSPRTIDTIYRGRFEESDGILCEQSKNGKNFYYINLSRIFRLKFCLVKSSLN